MEVREKLRLLRQAHQLSQEEMAERLGMSVQGYSKWERGETEPSLSKLEQFASILDLCLEIIFRKKNSTSINIQNIIEHQNNIEHLVVSKQYNQNNYYLQKELELKDEIIHHLKNENQLLQELLNQYKNK